MAVPEPADVAGQVPRTPPELPEPQAIVGTAFVKDCALR